MVTSRRGAVVWLATVVALVATAVALAPPSAAAVSDLEITEFLASNGGSLLDEDLDASDWIEIHNSGATPVDLTGLSLTDDATEPAKWVFPAVTLAPDGYLVVFASNKNRANPAGELHTNFALGAGGEYVGLYDIDGTTVLAEYTPEYPPQSADRSYGIGAGGDIGFFSTPTPGAANGPIDPLVADAPTADVARGFQNAPISVTLASTTAGAQIRYTTDGSTPTAASALASGPVAISTTTIVRAVAFAPGYLPSATTTLSYIYLADVAQQPATVAGFPNGASRDVGAGVVPLDMEMDPDVVNAYSAEMAASLQAIPTLSMTADLDDIFGPGGFYFTDDIEREASIELLYPGAGTSSEQIDVGVESHSHDRLKRSLRLNFRSDYGANAWVTDLFGSAPQNGDSVTDTHRTLILRSGNNRSWARSWNPDATAYTIDQLYRDSQIAMTGEGVHGTFVHLYLNGVYWGLYNLVERPDDEYQSEYFGGSDDDWFFTNHGGAGSADSTRWDYLVGALSDKDMSVPANYAEMQQYLDVQQFAEYVLLSFWMGMTDWPQNNWYVANRNASSPLGPTPAQFFAWDGEWSLDRKLGGGTPGAAVPVEFVTDAGSSLPILRIWHALLGSPEFRTLFNNRVAVHTAPGGALSDAAAIARWDTLNQYIESAVVAESARWGDSLESLGAGGDIDYTVTRTRDVDWQNEVDAIRGLLAGNAQRLIDALEAAGLYTDIGEPEPTFAITEMHYHPADPTAEEVAAGFTDADAFEFLELTNVSVVSLDVADLVVSGGVTANPASRLVAPGETIVLVSDATAFAFRYGTSAPVVGTYSGNLSNGGERIVVDYPAGLTIADFTYDDAAPWPTAPDGDGPSAVVLDPSGDLNDPANWAASTTPGGTPGVYPDGPVNVAPVVSVSAPVGGVSVSVGVPVSLGAVASDVDGSVVGVEFLVDGVVVGSDVSAPFGVSWTPGGVGVVSVTARATDDVGAVGVSDPVSVTVVGSPGGGSVSLVGSGSAGDNGGSSGLVLGVPAGVQAGDVIVVGVFVQQGVSVPTPAGFSVVADFSPSASWHGRLVVFAKVATGAESQVSFATGWVGKSGVIAVYRGAVLPVAASSQTSVDGSSITLPSVTVGSDGSRLVALYGAQNHGSPAGFSVPAAMAEQAELASLPWQAVGLADQSVDTGATGTRSIGFGAGSALTGVMIVLGPDGGGGPVNVAPVVSVSAPVGGVSVSVGVPVELGAVASDVDGSVVGVEFLVDGVVVGSDVSAPFGVSWTPGGVGVVSVTARATDDVGAVGVSDPVSVTVVGSVNAPPVVSVSAPVGGVSVSVGVPVELGAVASDVDGSVVGVEFLVDGVVVGSDVSAPFGVSWTPGGVGVVSVTARATDDVGAVGVSDPVSVTVVGSPGGGSVSLVGSASAGDNGGSSGLVLPVPGGVQAGDVILVGVTAQQGVSIPTPAGFVVVTDVVPSQSWHGRLVVFAKVATGAETQVSFATGWVGKSGVIAVYRGAVLPVAASSQTSVDGSSITLPSVTAASAGSRLVAFYGAHNHGTAAGFTPPAVMTERAEVANLAWLAAGASDETVGAGATGTRSIGFGAGSALTGVMIVLGPDGGGGPVNVAPVVSVSAPVGGVSVSVGVPVELGAVASDVDGSVVGVEFLVDGVVVGSDVSAPFGVSWTPGGVGVVSVTARATDDVGAVGVSDPVSVTVVGSVNAPPVVSVSAPVGGVSVSVGVPVELGAVASDVDGSVVGVEFLVDGVVVGSDVSAPFGVSWTPGGVGVVSVTARATDDVGAVGVSDPVSVTVVGSPGGGSVSLVGSGSAGDNGGSSGLVLGVPAGVQAGDVIVVGVFVQQGVSVPTPAGFSVVADFSPSASWHGRLVVFAKVATGAESQVSFATGWVGKSGVIAVYRGAVLPVAASSQTSVDGSSITLPSVTVGSDGSRLVALYGAQNHGSPAGFSVPAAMAEQAELASLPWQAVGLADQSVDTGATGTRSIGFGASSALTGVMIALTPTG